MKQPFRHFRGEFNGKYLYDLVTCPNYAVKDILDEMVYQALFTWKLEDEATEGELPIRHEDITNIAIIAGLFQLRSYRKASLGSNYFTLSHPVNGQERSERGLLDMDVEDFEFVRTEQDDYADDIVNEATDRLRMSLVPEGYTPSGYLPLGSSLYTDTGEIIYSSILNEPPTDGTPYTTLYGEKFLIHEEFFNIETLLSIGAFKLLLECVQRIRYNGPSVASFMEVAEILVPGYVYDIDIVSYVRYYVVFYSIDYLSGIADRDRRFAAWLNVCHQKFKLFVLEKRA